MKHKRATGLGAFLLVFSSAFAQDHPTIYVDRGACPFECCKYRDWVTEKLTRLYAEPRDGSSFIGVSEQGMRVVAETGEVQTRPGKLIVRRGDSVFKQGDILWVYTYLGEGFFKVWYRGEFIEQELGIDIHNPRPDDWSYFEILPESVWWVKLRTPLGIAGWSREPDNFSNKDACG